ncbi:MAG: hypothetical protein CTY34_05295 [Methylobacter sp.]|nr:MAG: hypothetical protein CTY34_05295 [Methylobacter sp.]PPD17587.1 MAG: hypothetical protein CTY24_14615 [Methylobacter sp.]PPD36811.1 MAG: hypothetical protein CTY18_03230 [Methylomonas sp.]
MHALTVDITEELQFSSQQKPYIAAMQNVNGYIDNTSEPEREAVSELIAEAFEPLLAYVETQNLRAANNDNF